MARTTVEEVKKIIDTDLNDSIIEAFINDANLIITDVFSGNSELSSDQLASLEKWLTAHLIACTRELQPAQEGVKDAKITYQGKTGIGLDATLYGQQCKLIDTTGLLARRLGQKRASIYAIPFDTDWEIT